MRSVHRFTATRRALAAGMIIVLVFAMAGVSVTPAPAAPGQTAQPERVVIPGTIQSVLGCPGDWQPDCDQTALIYSAEDDLWINTFTIPAGNYEYKVALNGNWGENYGLNARRDGPNIPLRLAEETEVTFVWSRASNWVTDSVNSAVLGVIGTFQSEIGCAEDWQAACLRAWMQDVDGDGKYAFVTTSIPPGEYEARIARDRSADGSLGADGTPDGPDFAFTVAREGQEIYFEWNAMNGSVMLSEEGAPKGNIRESAAHWVTANTILWNPTVPDVATVQFALHYDPEGLITLSPQGISGGEVIPLRRRLAGVHASIVARFPHLRTYQALLIPDEALPLVPDILRGQVVITATDRDGRLQDATSLQIPGVLDDLYFYDGELGAIFRDGAPTLRVWAPTARSVTLHLFADSNPATEAERLPMTLDPEHGLWSIEGTPDWMERYYLYEVEVYVHATGRVERNLVTDPYSVSLALNSTRSQIIDLAASTWMPEGWGTVSAPPLEAPEDVVLYELHVRDFSAYDQSVRPEYRGTFMAFTEQNANGMRHLRALAEAGLTHLHLLPIFDIATINEDRSQWQSPDPGLLATFPPDSPEQQRLIDEVRDLDGFNWGYDPFHYNVPEGSYSTDPDGPARIVELRQAVQSLHTNGLRVVMDVVYNHTNASGQSERSVLDRIVPGYYHRLNRVGEIERSTCCENTATEHLMMEKLMIDSVLLWARHYRIDGFRFDLMGHHLRANMLNLRSALDALTVEEDGVDGRAIYLYGEGWDFGEVANNARGRNATQINMAGTGIGTFNDRIRDSARGGSPFGGQQEQGFVNGLYTNPNETDQGSPESQLARLLLFTDRIRVGLAGNLAGFQFINASGELVTGDRIDYNGAPTGYNRDPQEHIVYVEAHDNETLFDAIQYKAPRGTSMADRVRMQNLGLSLTALSQGVPFFHAGMDMLRSKSFDRDSYNSGDWFNALDWTYVSNGWGRGLPIADKNQSMWPIIGPLLADPALRPEQEDILRSAAVFRELLQIRSSTPLFRLRTADDILARLQFHNTGPDQVPGLIVMSIDNRHGETLDGPYRLVVVVFNARPDPVSFSAPGLAGVPLTLHPVLRDSVDPVVRTSAFDSETGTLTVPALTTAVFVLEHLR